MKIIGDLVIFRSKEPDYRLEKSGRKPNTGRLMTTKEIEWLLKHDPTVTDIRIEPFEQSDKFFERELTDISIVGEAFGYKLVVLSWIHEGTVVVRK